MWHGIKSLFLCTQFLLGALLCVYIEVLCTKLLPVAPQNNDEMSAETENFHLMSQWSFCSGGKETNQGQFCEHERENECARITFTTRVQINKGFYGVCWKGKLSIHTELIGKIKKKS